MRGTKLYNLILTLWLLLMPSLLWLFTLPADFIVDLTVSAVALRLSGAREIEKGAQDFNRTYAAMGLRRGFRRRGDDARAGAGPFFLRRRAVQGLARLPCARLDGKPRREPLIHAVDAGLNRPFGIRHLQEEYYNVCFRRAELTDKQRRCASLALAVLTAPWFFFLSAGALERR